VIARTNRIRRLAAAVAVAAVSVTGVAATTDGSDVEVPIDEPTTTTPLPVDEPTTTTTLPVAEPTTTTSTTVPSAEGPASGQGGQQATAPTANPDLGALSVEASADEPHVWHSNPATVELVNPPHTRAIAYWFDSATTSSYGGSVPVNASTFQCLTTYVTWVVRMELLPSGPPFHWTGFRNVDLTIKKDGSHGDSVAIPTIEYIEDTLHANVDEIAPAFASFTPYCHNDPWDSGGSSAFFRGNVFNRLESRVDPSLSGPPDPPDNRAPNASFTATPITPTAGLYQLVSTSTDPDAGDVLAYEWDFGDGSPHALGAAATHQYTTPGTHVARLTVTDLDGATDVAQQQIEVAAPELGVAIGFPERPTGQVSVGEDVKVRVTLSASNGLGDLTDVGFVSDALRVVAGSQILEVVDEPDIPSPLTLEPGAPGTSFDFTVRASAPGGFTLASTAQGKDAAGRTVGPLTTQAHGSATTLRVELESPGEGTSALALDLVVTNTGTQPINDITYDGGGVLLRPELLPEQLRGGVRQTAGPTPALPTVLQGGESARTTFRFAPTAAGAVVVTAKAQGTTDGESVTAIDVGDLVVEAAPGSQSRSVVEEGDLSRADIAAFIAYSMLHASQQQRAAVSQVEQVANDTLLKGLKSGQKLDSGRLFVESSAGLMTGFAGKVGDVGEALLSTPAQYWGDTTFDSMTSFEFWHDFGDTVLAGAETAGGALDAASYGVFAALANAWYAQESQVAGATPLAGPRIDGTVEDAMLATAREIELSNAALDARQAALLRQVSDAISAEPYEFARKIGTVAGQIEGEIVLSELIGRGGSKALTAVGDLVDAARSRADVAAAARRLVAGVGQLEALGENAVLTTAQLEALGGITQQDASRIQAIVRRVKELFGVDIELQARPSNPYSAPFLNSAEGALGKSEILKVKSLQDVDVVLGADPRSLGKVGVFEPKLPPSNVMDSLPPELQKQVRDRFKTQAKNWADWNDPSSELAQNYAKVSQPGGADISFTTPTEKGAKSGGTRSIHLEADIRTYDKRNTITFYDRPTGKEIVSDVDFHATLQIVGEDTRALSGKFRGEVQAFLQREFSSSGIAFGKHGITVDAFDWPGLGKNVKSTTKWLEFIIDHSSPEQAERLIALWTPRLKALDPSFEADDLRRNVNPGSFVIKFRADTISTGFGASP
jgi:PKD repeat protein